MTPTDAEIIDRSRHEPDAFAAIFDRHAPHIRRYLARRLGTQVADDLVAETFLAAFDKRERYDQARPDAQPWLYGIATNLVGRHRRQEARRYQARSSDQSDAAEADHADRVAAEVTAQAMRSMLAGALGGLSDEDRDVLLLVAWEQLAYEEVAAALAIPVGTVRSRLNRARRKVRQALGGSNPTEIEELLNNG
ncbi:RNA polymerase sigma-70 factor (ECF subfamily) [Saccharothrix ecbatanensis]|uniref:RNA polymerase sigma-70 factor (ECF subfamily) n=1 Tax=Saccharothrix ecbatanensis TaxID=1105145 RepID=A0A7W9M252_9PSEU|nr:RNA polymerase sigma factor [Saccharothrix ecbatanensis]MBB5804644.1 RNA polymerase sigma-70 factor (ECF subfamily) [Saccharothrix ecbatanensis]